MSEDLPQLVYHDEHLLIVHKPARMYVHPPDDPIARKATGRHTLLHWLKDLHGLRANPIHRLDFPTEGLVLFGLTPKSSSELNKMMRARSIEKYYDVIVRGWFNQENSEINIALESDSSGELMAAQTLYQTYKKIELPVQINSPHPTTRYSWLHIELKTGRWHQIRRHMNRTSHPVVGDREHGDSRHNQYFRDHLGINGLCLKAKKLKFVHPIENKIVEINAPQTELWDRLEKLFL